MIAAPVRWSPGRGDASPCARAVTSLLARAISGCRPRRHCCDPPFSPGQIATRKHAPYSRLFAKTENARLLRADRRRLRGPPALDALAQLALGRGRVGPATPEIRQRQFD